MSTENTTETQAQKIAEALVSSDADWLEALEALKPHLPTDLFTAVCEMCGVCPVHLCDEEICIDDAPGGCEASGRTGQGL